MRKSQISVRQLTNSAGAVTYAASYSPYGEVSQAGGVGQSAYGYTGEMQSGNLVYLRARYVNVSDGRFLSRDTWGGNYNRPLSLNRWNYTEANPVNYVDPSGYCKKPASQDQDCWALLLLIEVKYPFIDLQTGLSAKNYWIESELERVEKELGELDQASTMDLNQEFSAKEIRVDRYHSSKYCGMYSGISNRIFLYDVYNTSSCNGTLVHEIGHYWAFRDNLDDPFIEYVNSHYDWLFWYKTCEDEAPPSYGDEAPYLPPSAHEDFAESLSEYVLLYNGHDAKAINANIKKDEKRWKFIQTLLDTGDVPPPPSP